jgi:hypothetical protein
MADIKISQLNSLTTPADSDVLVINDVSVSTTKQITFGNLLQNYTQNVVDSATGAKCTGDFVVNNELTVGGDFTTTATMNVADINADSVGCDTLTVDNLLVSSSDGIVNIGTSTKRFKNVNLKEHLNIYNGTAPTGSLTDGVILYAEDDSASSELKVRDEAGNITTLSPHNFKLIPEGPSEDMAWSYYSEKDGKRINVDMLKALRVLESLSGEKLIFED